MRLIRRLWCVATIVLVACKPGGAAREANAVPQVTAPLTYSVEDVYQNTRFRGISWSADGGTLLVSSDLSGIWNAYAIPRGGGDPGPPGKRPA